MCPAPVGLFLSSLTRRAAQPNGGLRLRHGRHSIALTTALNHSSSWTRLRTLGSARIPDESSPRTIESTMKSPSCAVSQATTLESGRTLWAHLERWRRRGRSSELRRGDVVGRFTAVYWLEPAFDRAREEELHKAFIAPARLALEQIRTQDKKRRSALSS